MLPGPAVAEVTSFCTEPFKAGVIEIGRILHDRMDVQRHLPFPTNQDNE